MHDLPHAADLLATARDSLLNDLLPHLPAAQKYTALMIANAIGIGGREQTGSTAAQLARSELYSLVNAAAVTTTENCIGSEQKLCSALRGGALDSQLVEMLPGLRKDVLARLQVGNPKYLQLVQEYSSTLPGGVPCHE